MTITFRITRKLFGQVHADLVRPHVFAAERVGWLRCCAGDLPDGGLVVLAHNYRPVADDDYLDDASAGAVMGSAAIRKALQLALDTNVAMFHVHIHDHNGRPGFSTTDSRETAKFVPDFWHVRPGMPHGALVFSRDSAYGRVWYPGGQVIQISVFEFVGAPLRRTVEEYATSTRSSKLSRHR